MAHSSSAKIVLYLTHPSDFNQFNTFYCFNLKHLLLNSNFSKDQFIWVTVDLQQKFEYFGIGYDITQIPDIRNSTRRHLMFIHRCTRSVRNEYRENTSFLVDMGHQYEVRLVIKIAKL
jgi:hypothetical protein